MLQGMKVLLHADVCAQEDRTLGCTHIVEYAIEIVIRLLQFVRKLCTMAAFSNATYYCQLLIARQILPYRMHHLFGLCDQANGVFFHWLWHMLFFV